MTAEAAEDEITLGGEEVGLEGESISPSENDDGSEPTSEQKNSSNWKKMSETKKALERELRAEKEAKASLNDELAKLKEWANSLYEDESQKPFAKKEEALVEAKADILEKKLFLIENKEAKEHIDLVDGARKKYGMDYDDAWDFVKAKLPKESVSKTSIDVKTKTPGLSKDLTKVSAEDALSLPKEEQRKWRVANGWEKA